MWPSLNIDDVLRSYTRTALLLQSPSGMPTLHRPNRGLRKRWPGGRLVMRPNYKPLMAKGCWYRRHEAGLTSPVIQRFGEG